VASTGPVTDGGDDLVEAARRVADDVLAPAAQATDQAPVVPASHMEALAGAGLCGLAGPPDHGGVAAPAVVTRQVYEVLAGACGVTFFVWVQHHAPVRLLAASANVGLRERWLAQLCRGDVVGGVAFAYLRRPDPPAVVARRVQGGWLVDGEAPWVTSWGLARLFAVAARAGLRVLFFALDAAITSASVQASTPLALAAMGASATVRLSFDGLFVPDDDVISSLDAEEWRRRDAVGTAQPHPAPLGVAATSVRLLGRQGARSGDPASAAAAVALASELEDCRAHAYGLVDGGGDGPAHLARLVDARAWGLDLALRSAQALVAATGGRAMALTHPAQRLLREAAFYAIQAQTTAVRQATLALLAPKEARQRPTS
jgi:alkylation response protein AidB-like acyl-CoA dehydrogenase